MNDTEEMWSYIRGLREDLGYAEQRIRDLEDRCGRLEGQTPDAQQAQLEADQAMADLAATGYREHDDPYYQSDTACCPRQTIPDSCSCLEGCTCMCLDCVCRLPDEEEDRS